MIAALLLSLLAPSPVAHSQGAPGPEASAPQTSATAAEAWLSYPTGPDLATTVPTHAFPLELGDGTRVGIVASAAAPRAGLPATLESPGGVGQIRAWVLENAAGERVQLGDRARVTDSPFHALDWDPNDASPAFELGELTDAEGAPLGLVVVGVSGPIKLPGFHTMDDDALHYLELDDELTGLVPFGSPVVDAQGRAVGVLVAQYEPTLWGIEELSTLNEAVPTWNERHRYTSDGVFFEGALASASTRAILLHMRPDGSVRLRIVDWLERETILERVYAPEEDVSWPALSPDGRFAALLYEGALEWFDLERNEERTLAAPFSPETGYQMQLSGRSIWFETEARPLTRMDVDSGAKHVAPEALGRGWIVPSNAPGGGPVFGSFDGVHLELLGLPGQPRTKIHQEDYWVDLGTSWIDANARQLFFSYNEGYGVAGIALQTGDLKFYWDDYAGYLDALALSPSGARLVAVESVGITDGELNQEGEVIDLPQLDEGETAFAGFVHELEAGTGLEQRRSLAFDAFGLEIVTLGEHTAVLLSDGSIRVF